MLQTSQSKKVNVSFTFFENIFWSGLTLFSSYDIINYRNQYLKMFKNLKKINKNLKKQENWVLNERRGKQSQIMMWKIDNL